MSQTAKSLNTGLSIRPASERDIPVISQLAHAIWPVAYDGILLPEHISNMLERMYNHDDLKKQMTVDGHRFWLASINERPVAFMSGYREDDVVWLKKIYVDPACKGQGVGKALIATLEQAFAPASEMRLLVNPKNFPAMDFYRHVGFVESGRQEVQMGDFRFVDFVFSRQLKA
jgi:ribosomal protein S18 acetylase RimI-like enzyme